MDKQTPQAKPANHPIDITLADFEAMKAKPTTVLIDFWAEWCGPCRVMSPVIDQISSDYPDVTFAKVNVDDEGELANMFGIQSIPTFYMLKMPGDGTFDMQRDGVGKVVGALSPFDFKQAIDKLVEKAATYHVVKKD
jgi:thioredoxin